MGSPSSGMSGALANIIELARLSPLTLLYHSADASTPDAGQQQAAALASAAANGAAGEVVVLFDAGSDLPVPDLLAAIEAAVLEAAPEAPLAPPMAGPVEALAFWQQALGLRFVLIMHRFDMALSRPEPEFDEVLLRLAHGPLDISVLLIMNEAAAPLLQRLKTALPELGETFLRLPEPTSATAAPSLPPERMPAAPPVPVPAPHAAEAAPAARFGPAPFLFDDPDEVSDGDEADLKTQRRPAEQKIERPVSRQQTQPEKPPEEQRQQEQVEERRRSRRFSSLLEQAGTTTDAFNPPADAAVQPDTAPPALTPPPAEVFSTELPADRLPAALPLEIYPAAAPEGYAAPGLPLPDGRAEPTFHAAAAAATPAAAAVPATARAYRERRPMQVPAWMQKRRSRRRRGTVGIASRVGNSSTVLFVLLIMLAVLGWQMPQLGTSGAAVPRGAAALHDPAEPPQAVALRGNRYRLSISSAASSAGTGRETR